MEIFQNIWDIQKTRKKKVKVSVSEQNGLPAPYFLTESVYIMTGTSKHQTRSPNKNDRIDGSI